MASCACLLHPEAPFHFGSSFYCLLRRWQDIHGASIDHVLSLYLCQCRQLVLSERDSSIPEASWSGQAAGKYAHGLRAW
jgi:hypothetical protein